MSHKYKTQQKTPSWEAWRWLGPQILIFINHKYKYKSMGFSRIFKALPDTELNKMYQGEKKEETAAILSREKNRLQGKFGTTSIPWVIRNEVYYKLASIISVLANLLSASFLAYLVLSFLGIIPYPSLQYFIAGCFLIGFEILKRFSSDKNWDEFMINYYELKKSILQSLNWFWFSFSKFLFVCSLLGSVYGIVYFTTDHSPELGKLKSKLEKIENDIAYHESNKNSKGQWVWASRERCNGKKTKSGKVITKGLYVEREELKNQLEVALAASPNAETTTASEDIARSEHRVYASVFFTVFLEIVFECLMFFRSLYDYKKYKFITSLSNSSTPNSIPIPYSNDVDIKDQLKHMFEQLKEELAASPNSYPHRAPGFYSDSSSDDKSVRTNAHESYSTNIVQLGADFTSLVKALKAARIETGKYVAKLRNKQGKVETNIASLDRCRKEELRIFQEMEKCTNTLSATM